MRPIYWTLYTVSRIGYLVTGAVDRFINGFDAYVAEQNRRRRAR